MARSTFFKNTYLARPTSSLRVDLLLNQLLKLGFGIVSSASHESAICLAREYVGTCTKILVHKTRHCECEAVWQVDRQMGNKCFSVVADEPRAAHNKFADPR
jgi:hypothetical protein